MVTNFWADAMKENPIPNFYSPPMGVPLYWRDEQSGQLENAIFAYLEFVTKHATVPPNETQIFLIRYYFEHYIMAPCWQDDGNGTLTRLREDTKNINSVEAISAWLKLASEIALDPL
ncbi:MAG: hypothetical protein KME29_03770 [Calothrix sp. FI2-JRJ7]|jgi:hypothetical protein|nr:hypothetical protein [Calothrix sp. FI2-JRJ7]MBW4598738.1 hypothetical protein [Calothrix sp. FI2-JRJ7]